MDTIYFLTDISNVEISLVSCWLPVLRGFLYINFLPKCLTPLHPDISMHILLTVLYTFP